MTRFAIEEFTLFRIYFSIASFSPCCGIISRNNIICIFFGRAKKKLRTGPTSAGRIDPLRIELCRSTTSSATTKRLGRKAKHFPIHNKQRAISSLFTSPHFRSLLELYIATVNWSKCIVILPRRWLLSSSFLRLLEPNAISHCVKRF